MKTVTFSQYCNPIIICFRNSKIRSVLRQVQAFKLSELTTDFEIPMGLNGVEKNGDIIRFSFLSNQTSRFSRAGAFQQLAMTNGVRRHIAEVRGLRMLKNSVHCHRCYYHIKKIKLICFTLLALYHKSIKRNPSVFKH